MLLQVHRDLLVADSAEQRSGEQVSDEPRKPGSQHDPESHDRLRGEPCRFERPRREDEQDQSECRHSERPAQRQLHPPSPADLTDDVEEFGREIFAHSYTLTLPIRLDTTVSNPSNANPANSRYHHTRCARSCSAAVKLVFAPAGTAPPAFPVAPAARSPGAIAVKSDSFRSTLDAIVIGAGSRSPSRIS